MKMSQSGWARCTSPTLFLLIALPIRGAKSIEFLFQLVIWLLSGQELYNVACLNTRHSPQALLETGEFMASSIH